MIAVWIIVPVLWLPVMMPPAPMPAPAPISPQAQPAPANVMMWSA